MICTTCSQATAELTMWKNYFESEGMSPDEIVSVLERTKAEHAKCDTKGCLCQHRIIWSR